MATHKTDTTLILRRVFDVPRERLYEARTAQAELLCWYSAAEDYVIHSVDIDLRVGGKMRASFGPKGEEPIIETDEYREIVPGQSLVFDMTLTRGDTFISKTRVIVEFKDVVTAGARSSSRMSAMRHGSMRRAGARRSSYWLSICAPDARANCGARLFGLISLRANGGFQRMSKSKQFERHALRKKVNLFWQEPGGQCCEKESVRPDFFLNQALARRRIFDQHCVRAPSLLQLDDSGLELAELDPPTPRIEHVVAWGKSVARAAAQRADDHRRGVVIRATGLVRGVERHHDRVELGRQPSGAVGGLSQSALIKLPSRLTGACRYCVHAAIPGQKKATCAAR